MDLEGALVPGEFLLHLGRRDGRARHTERQIAGRGARGGPGEGPQRDGGEGRDEQDDGDQAPGGGHGFPARFDAHCRHILDGAAVCFARNGFHR
ncbi:hypothetical protein AQJ64_11305 [Streptomyces griseoruber]|uniref:Uncharacterized protein n=1 Tax=Streptomyces griseoruber TaxID=1943 RepID=A0A101T4Q5_9ACTN|nr:hypothetical protein AQJ64_11305 [Streptomyces griseoruber]